MGSSDDTVQKMHAFHGIRRIVIGADLVGDLLRQNRPANPDRAGDAGGVQHINGFLHIDNLDVYVTGSNSKFLSSDIITEFRGRGDEVRIHPLSFSEFFNFRKTDWQDAWNEYYTFGGLPYIAQLSSYEEKVQYLKRVNHFLEW